jgi:hypothetical protein
MSVVSNVIVLHPYREAETKTMEPLTRVEGGRSWRGAFTNATEGSLIDAWVHDGKAPECGVWVGAFNHLNRSALLADLERLPWQDPSGVQVLIKWNDDECFGLWMFREDRLKEVPLPGWIRRPHSAWAVTPDGGHEIEIGVLAVSNG